MATQETSLRDQEEGAAETRESTNEKISLVVDRPAPSGLGVLIVPFATARNEEALGRQIGLVLQHRMQGLPELTTGHGQLIAVMGGTRRYLPLYRVLSAQQALACGNSWGAGAVLYGAITVQPALRWSVVLQNVRNGAILFEDTLAGEPEDLLDAPGDLALVLARALEIPIDEDARTVMETRETDHLDALLTYLQAVDLRPQHGVAQGDPEIIRRHLLRSLALDPAFRAPAALLIADILGEAPREHALDAIIGTMEVTGGYGTSGTAALARALDEQGMAEEAGVLATAVLRRDPLQPTALALAGHHAFRAGQIANAKRLAQTWLEAEPEHPGAHELLGNVLAASERFPGAAQHWELALSYQPDQPRLLLRLGSYLAVAGEYQHAYKLLNQANAMGQASTESLYQLGVVSYRLGLVSEAIAALQKALLHDPDRGNAHVMLARCYQRVGRSDLAQVHDARALDLLPTYWPSALARGHTALRRGLIAEALDAYTLVARARPDLPEALYGLGRTLLAGNRADEAMVVLARAHELRQEDVQILCALAVAYHRAGRHREAEQTLVRADALAPFSPAIARAEQEMAR